VPPTGGPIPAMPRCLFSIVAVVALVAAAACARDWRWLGSDANPSAVPISSTPGQPSSLPSLLLVALPGDPTASLSLQDFPRCHRIPPPGHTTADRIKVSILIDI